MAKAHPLLQGGVNAILFRHGCPKPRRHVQVELETIAHTDLSLPRPLEARETIILQAHILAIFSVGFD
jgi:hypothetical protein